MAAPPPTEERENRRTHTKSRTGCLVCKRRRVKCDETRPRCRKCTYGNRACVYSSSSSSTLHLIPGSPSPRPRPNGHDRAASARTHSAHHVSRPVHVHIPAINNASPSPSGQSPRAHPDGNGPLTSFSVLHLTLFYNAIANMADYMALQGDIHVIISHALGSASEAPYVLYQLLALSALHSSTRQPQSSAPPLQHVATELQTRALGLFNGTRCHLSDDTYLSAFLFASFLGVHSLHIAIAEHQHSASSFISAFVDYVHIHRGVRSVIRGYWDRIMQSDLKHLLSITAWVDEADTCSSEHTAETARLRACLDQSSSSSSSSPMRACVDATRWLEWILRLKADGHDDPRRDVQAVMAWPLLVSDEYTEALYQRRPEAVAVFAFYTAVMYQHRDFWVFRNVESGLVRAMVDHVGPYWADALSWPLLVVQGVNRGRGGRQRSRFERGTDPSTQCDSTRGHA
ncbi:uncharacterized protein F5Z01DRAFT_655161 [Emericellopsis atlantica]|uniref:Zn(2)-C6 fungal-type domain-containing protein n=1 Tax=Emericellopsis atlantica TaxID=2614577 RepID=A0A9P7ZLK5_9HYPO|nr:uncharacterized protein F5Z01DRAFT_655161 [Emericellopsis atlantica]KAG9254344.1 hypothetical protein F5Z01DRAFT_655161 [Emericellopsis atlantica]